MHKQDAASMQTLQCDDTFIYIGVNTMLRFVLKFIRDA